MQTCERARILNVCGSTGWKIKGPDGAAQILGLNPGTLYSRMKKPGLRRPEEQTVPKPLSPASSNLKRT